MSAIVRASSTDLPASFPASVAIPVGTALSSAFKIAQWAEAGFVIPAQFTGATVSFEVSTDDANNNQSPTYFPLYNNSNALISITVTAGKAYMFPADVMAFAAVKILSASNETPGRVIQVFGKG